jgi:hypothetical protein
MRDTVPSATGSGKGPKGRRGAAPRANSGSGARRRSAHPAAARREGPSGSRSRRPLRRRVACPDAGRQAQPGPLPLRLLFPVESRRMGQLEITNCDFKLGRKTAGSALCVHGAGSRDAVERPPQPPRGGRERRDHARLRPLPSRPGRARGHADLARRVDELERKYDGQFGRVFDALRALMEPPPEEEAQPPRRIGFRSAEEPR